MKYSRRDQDINGLFPVAWIVFHKFGAPECYFVDLKNVVSH